MEKRLRLPSNGKKQPSAFAFGSVSEVKRSDTSNFDSILDESTLVHGHRKKKQPDASALVKGVTQIDYIVAAGVFILVFALVVQFTTNYFSNISEKTNIRIMSDQARQLLDVAERGPQPASWPYIQNSSILMMLHLDNSTLDSGQYGNNGTISGTNCSAAVAGRLDTSCSFDGIDDFISVNDQANINFTTGNSFTVEAWVNPQALAGGSWPVVVKQSSDTGTGWRLFLDTASRELRGFVCCGDAGGVTLTSYSNVTNSSWSHVALVVDRAANVSSLYLNGVAVNSSANISFVGNSRNNAQLTIGRGIAVDPYYFNGSIDDVLIWNRSLTAGEIYNRWAYENLLDRIGLMSNAYEFYIIVNNTAQFWKNQSLPVETIGNEQVIFNYTDLGYGANVPSTAIYEANGSVVPYNINGNVITFRTQIAAGTVKYFTVYFDDNSNFAEQTQAITGVDNLTESIGHVQAFPIVQYRNLLFLNNSNYTRVMNATGMPRDFSVRLIDTGTSVTILNFGPPPPPSGSVVAFQRYMVYQNSTGAVRRGRIVVQTW